MPKKRRIDPEWWARMEAQRRELEDLFERRLQRLAFNDGWWSGWSIINS